MSEDVDEKIEKKKTKWREKLGERKLGSLVKEGDESTIFIPNIWPQFHFCPKR